ncbi:MAG: high-affinity branched-chain amino acid ABC transporter permease LivM [Alphaproteobacteria bacterium]|nr:high-affinity branched-chain amino acid ABC transporter permease LivM [Alphaproteobacteria bacterium]
MGAALAAAIKEAFLAALVTVVLAVPIIGMRTFDSGGGILGIDYRWVAVATGVVMVFFGRLYMALARRRRVMAGAVIAAVGAAVIAHFGFVLEPLATAGIAGAVIVSGILRLSMTGIGEQPAMATAVNMGRRAAPFLLFAAVAFAVALPFFKFSNRYVIDIATLMLIYVMLGWGLNIVVGLAGLLDLGYVAFYAVGAYSYALLAIHFDWSFWVCLPLAGALSALFGIILGFPVLRLRGDYLAIVTLGFGEMVRIILINWYEVTKGPDGLSGIPRPSFFGLPFKRRPPEGMESFHQFFDLDYSSMHRLTFLYFLILALALVTNFFTERIRRLPVGRAWEALREDEIASRALGINPTNTKLTAFAIGAMFAGFAGSFFATRQGFISPESFVFLESAIVLSIVVLGGMGSQIGVVVASFVLIVVPELIRELAEYRMLAFGVGMVLIMIWRPRGLIAHREPSLRLHRRGFFAANAANARGDEGE